MALEIRVLVVEDDPETRMLTEALLSGRKGVCLCALAKDGLEGAIPLKEGYAAAMAAQNTSYACVEKNIRSMVGKLQAGACGEYQALMGGLPAERPSNELFLRRLARRILEW